MMKKTLSLLLVLAMLLTAAVTMLTSCSDDDGEVGADIHVYMSGRLYDFDPSLAIVDDDAAQILSLMYEPLFKLKSDGSVSPALAEEYEIDKKARKMTITIRDTNWSNSKPVTSNDVICAWQRILDPNAENPAATLLYDIRNAVEVKLGGTDDATVTISDLGVDAPDTKTLVIYFRDDVTVDYDAFLRNLTSVALSPVPEDIVSITQRADHWSKTVSYIATNGPFTLKALDYKTGEFSLQRNRYYRRDKDSTTSLTEYVVPQFLSSVWSTEFPLTAEQYEEFLNSEIIVHYASKDNQYADSLYYMGELPLAVRKEGTFASETKVKDMLSASTVVLNTKYGNPVLANKSIRQALSLVVDRQAIAEALVYAKPATGFITAGVYEAGNAKKDFRKTGGELISTTADMAGAEALIAQGMSELGLTDKSQLGTLRLMYSVDSVNDPCVAAYVAEAWTALGFTVILDPLTGKHVTLEDDINVYLATLQLNYNSQWDDIRDANEIPYTDEQKAAIKAATDAGKAAPEFYADAILIDYQMLSTDPFAALCGFSSTMSGNGYDNKTDISEDGSHEYSYAPVPHVSGYVSEAYDEKINAAFTAKKASERSALLHEAETILLDDMPIIPLLFNQDFYVVSKKLTKLSTSEYGYTVFTKAYLEGYESLKPSPNTEEEAENN